jgi:uncharacterized protein YbaP (TraB family)
MKSVLIIFCVLGSFVRAQLLYQITGKELAQPSYIYGTIHLLPKAKFELPKSLERAFKSCATIAMEVDLNMTTGEKIAMAQRAVLPNGKSLKDFMDPQDYIQLKMFCMDSLKWNENKFNRSSRLQPMFFSSLLIKESMSNMASYEMEFNKMAKKQHKKTIGLETIDFQLSIFEKIPMSTQIGMLKDDYNSNLNTFDTLLSYYLKEDLEGLNSMMLEETAQYPEFNELFLLARNRNWIEPMIQQMQIESTFFAVGAGHLGGTEGVIQLLKAKGYTLTPIEKE